MAPIEAAGAGVVLRADRVDAGAVRRACERLLASTAAGAAARRLQPMLGSPDSIGAAFDAVAERLLPGL
jgi:UDP:flavonoid glycosyltransferase YjiC (YdhE family)